MEEIRLEIGKLKKEVTITETRKKTQRRKNHKAVRISTKSSIIRTLLIMQISRTVMKQLDSSIGYDTIDDLLWKTDRQAASLI